MPGNDISTKRSLEHKNSAQDAERVAKWLSSIKSKTQNITDALKEIGTVSPGSGLMPDQMPKFSREEYLRFANSTFTEALEGFENELSLIKISSGQEHEFATIGGFIIAEANSDNNGRRKILELSTHKQDCGNDAACIKIGSLKLASNSWDIKNATDYQETEKLEYRNNEKVYLKSIAKSTFDSIFLKNNNKAGENGVCRFNKKKFIEYIQSSTDSLHSICRTDESITYINSTTNSGTTPTIGCNSTKTSITNATLSTTTSRPRQDADAGHIAATAVVACLVGFSLIIIPFMIYYCWNKVCCSGQYYTGEKGQEEGTPPAKDTQPLLNQPSTSTNGGIEISDGDASKVANAVRENSSPKRTQAQVHTQPPSGEKASPSLEAAQVEGSIQQASAIG
ncbi:hypothetical protein [Candidatus Mesenet endosymbiont of Phosphuga atrata]|uniref:hypothetical protein n=1 Tax=Candidatus Mesenet endosymbiont of Phosphuga atrata TaxID=3066221 RepID=UPI0030D282D4